MSLVFNWNPNPLARKQIGRMFERGFGSQKIAGHFCMTELRIQQICQECEVAGLIAIVGPALKAAKEREVLVSPSIIATPIARRPLRKAVPKKMVTKAGKNADVILRFRVTP